MAENEGRPLAAGGGDLERGGQPAQPHSTPSRAPGQAKVVFSAQGGPIGTIEGSWLVKRGLDPERHMLHSPSGWCTDAEHLRLPIAGVRLYTTDGQVWEASLALWQRYGQPLDRRWGAQVLLPARYWRVERRGVRQLALLEVDS